MTAVAHAYYRAADAALAAAEELAQADFDQAHRLYVEASRLRAAAAAAALRSPRA